MGLGVVNGIYSCQSKSTESGNKNLKAFSTLTQLYRAIPEECSPLQAIDTKTV